MDTDLNWYDYWIWMSFKSFLRFFVESTTLFEGNYPFEGHDRRSYLWEIIFVKTCISVACHISRIETLELYSVPQTVHWPECDIGNQRFDVIIMVFYPEIVMLWNSFLFEHVYERQVRCLLKRILRYFAFSLKSQTCHMCTVSR